MQHRQNSPKTRHWNPRLASENTESRNISRPNPGSKTQCHQNTRRAHAMEFHRTTAGARPADPTPCLTTQKGAAPCSLHVCVACVRGYGFTGGHTPTKSSPCVLTSGTRVALPALGGSLFCAIQRRTSRNHPARAVGAITFDVDGHFAQWSIE